jgi:sugar phosphate isomerase/epimerase
MLIGAMNHPGKPVVKELEWMATLGLDFVDLTLEPPAAAAGQVDAKTIRRALSDLGMGVIGHTAYYLPLASPFESLRRAAVEELKLCLRAFAEIGAKWMNVHPGRQPPLHTWEFTVRQNLRTLSDLLPYAQECGVRLMVENIPGEFNTVAELGELLDALPDLGLHLDIGHCNLMVRENSTEGILQRYGSRLCHVHLHDNKGGNSDLHLPLGCGNIDLTQHVRSLRAAGYDSTITLEVFTPDSAYVEMSRDILRRVWDECAPAKARETPRSEIVRR